MPMTPSVKTQNPQLGHFSEVEAETPISLRNVTEALGHEDRQVRCKIRWEWNLPLLGISAASVVGLLILAVFIHTLQARRVAEGLSNLAKKAMSQQDHAMEVKWLKQLVAFDFRYDRALERLAIASNQSVSSLAEIDQARQSLVRAMATLNDSDELERLQKLRRLLIQRLLEMPATWAVEAEKQILLLQAHPDDHEVLRWLALSLFVQVENGEWRPRLKSRFDKDKDYWNWMSSQSVGNVLEFAEAVNPKASDLKIALLSTYVERPELLESPLNDNTRQVLNDKARRVIEVLQTFDDGRAEWACFAFLEKLDKQQSGVLLTEITSKAVDRLLSPETSLATPERQDIRPATRYWDMNIAMARAEKLEAEGRFEEADSLYNQLITVNKNLIPEEQLADLHLRFGRSLWKRQDQKSALDILRKGCKEISPSSALELWELIAIILCAQDDRDQAATAIAELEQAIQVTRNAYFASPIRDAVRERELKRLTDIRWQTDLLKSEQKLRSNTNWPSIQELVELLQSQQDIPTSLRLQAHLLLANAYSRIGLWDLEARTLEDALHLVPDDKFIRKRLADAWLRAGILARAEPQLKLADDGSFTASLQRLQVVIEIQQAMPAAMRKIDRLRQLQNQTQQRLSNERAAGKAPENAWVFDMLKLCHTVDSLDSVELELAMHWEKDLLQLVHAFADQSELQALAARSFDSIGNEESTALALSNLDRLKAQSPQIWLDTNLRIQLRRKHKSQAMDLIQQATTEKILPALTLHRVAANAFLEVGDTEEACNILLKSKETDDISYLFFLANKLLETTPNQGQPSNSESPSTDFTLAMEQVVARVQELEGPQGTLGQYLDATKFLRSAQSTGNSKDLDQATKTILRVTELRPRWADALKLAGDIRAAAFDSEKAVTYYRGAITEGDLRVATVFLLAQQLSQLGRFSEAEFEFQRISHLSAESRAISEFAIGLELQKGKEENALDLARLATSQHPQNTTAWLLQAQAAEKRHARTGGREIELLDEAERCLQKASEISGAANPAIWVTQLRFCSRFRGPEATESLIEKLRNSSLSEKSRGILTAQAYTRMFYYSKAIDALSIATKKLPYDLDILNALAEVYRLNGQPSPSLEILEKAYRINPKRSDIARSLAIMLATHTPSGGTVPWARIGSIAEGIEAQSTDAKRLFYAFLLATRGAEQQRDEALKVLSEMLSSSELLVAQDAIRLSITIHRQAWEDANRAKRPNEMLVRQREIQRLFDTLWRAPERLTLINDWYQHADFLLQLGERDRVVRLIEELDQFSSASPLLLNLRFQVALAEGKAERLAEKVHQWVGKELDNRNAPLLAEAGRLLSVQGLHFEALPYLQSAYQIDPQWLRPLIVALSRAGKIEDAFKLCVERYRVEPTLETVSVLVDLAIFSVGQFPLEPQIDQIIMEALTKFPLNYQLLELTGTLRLFQQRYQEAFSLLIRSEKLAPQSVITLNNLAIVASEIPGREQEGLARIEKAIERFGRSPDLLDTLGVVQLTCGLAAQAETNLAASWKEKQDARTLLHLIQSLQAQGKQTELRERLKSLKLSDMRGIVLTTREQKAIESLRQTNPDLLHAEQSL